MITDNLRDKLSKIYALVNNGATEGERAAAKIALDRIIETHNIDEADLLTIEYRRHMFTYTTAPELKLLYAIVKMFASEAFDRLSRRKKVVAGDLTHLEFVTIDCAYEYFRRHMKAEWKKVCAPQLARCRTAKTKARRRKELQPLFIEQYIIKSCLVPKDAVTIKHVQVNTKEGRDLCAMQAVEGGTYNQQLTRGLLLENK